MKNKVTSLQHTYQSQLQDIGAVLKSAREARQITIDAVANQTLIRSSLLKAMELGDMAQLPEPVYIRGLIRRYGDFLGLDGEALAIQFFTPAQSRGRGSWKNSAAAQLRPLHLYIAYVMVMVTAITGLSYLLRRTSPEMSSMPPLEPLSSQERSVSSQSSSETGSTETSTAAKPAAEEAHPIEVQMTLTAQSWLRVVSDGEMKFEGILQQGDSRSWTAEEKLTIRAGNAGGVVVSYNSGQSQRLGEPGMVAEVTYASNESVSLAF